MKISLQTSYNVQYIGVNFALVHQSPHCHNVVIQSSMVERRHATLQGDRSGSSNDATPKWCTT